MSDRVVVPTSIALALGAGVLVALQWGVKPPPVAGAFSRADVDRLFLPTDGAGVSAQILYHCFKREHDPALPCPAWLDAEVAKMTAPALVYEGEPLTEAELWRAPAAVLYEALEVARRRFPPASGGRDLPLAAVAADQAESAARCRQSLERLPVSKMSTLGGRREPLLEMYGEGCAALARAAVAAQAGDEAAYRDAVMTSGAAIVTALDVVRRTP